MSSETIRDKALGWVAPDLVGHPTAVDLDPGVVEEIREIRAILAASGALLQTARAKLDSLLPLGVPQPQAHPPEPQECQHPRGKSVATFGSSDPVILCPPPPEGCDRLLRRHEGQWVPVEE